MKRIRKLLAVFLAAVFVAAVLPVSAEGEKGTSFSVSLERYYSANTSSLQLSEQSGLGKYLVENVEKCVTSLDISSYNVDLSELKNILVFLTENPKLFNLQKKLDCQYWSSNTIATLEFSYNPDFSTVSKYKAALEKCEKYAAKLTAGLNGLSDAEKALVLHDKIAVMSNYCTDNGNDSGHKNCNPNIYNIYGLLVDHNAVCEGYALTYKYLLDKVGISSRLNPSEYMTHVWNIVKINNKEYHVDVTWDDPVFAYQSSVYDYAGNVSHKYFLVNTEKLISDGKHGPFYDSENKYLGYDFDRTPFDSDFNNGYWSSVNSQIIYLGGSFYYIDGGSLMKMTGNVGSVVTGADLSELWYADVNSYWQGNYSKIADDGISIYYSTPTKVYRYNTESNTAKVIYNYNSENYSGIKGIKLLDNTLICQTARTPNIAPKTSDNAVINVGDANGDGQTNILDFIKLKKLLAEKSTQSINGIGVPETTDLVWIKRLLLAG